MKFTQFVQLIATGLQARIPMHITGFPGVGKTEFTKSLEAGFTRVAMTIWSLVVPEPKPINPKIGTSESFRPTP